MRTCKYCGESKPESKFKITRRGNQTWLGWKCRECLTADALLWNQKNPDKVLASRVKMKYNLTLEEYRTMLASGCEICGELEGLHIDHDHTCCPGQNTCGKCVRGVLCNRHNVALGMVNDSTEELEGLIGYLASRR